MKKECDERLEAIKARCKEESSSDSLHESRLGEAGGDESSDDGVGDRDEETIEEEELDEAGAEGEAEGEADGEGLDILYHACLPIFGHTRCQVYSSLLLHNLGFNRSSL